MELCEGSVKLRLEQRRVLPQLVQLLLEFLSAENGVVVPLQKLGLILGPLDYTLHQRSITSSTIRLLPSMIIQ